MARNPHAKVRLDQYKVTPPGEASRREQDLLNAAIDQARERAKIYAIPARWTAYYDAPRASGGPSRAR